jgi:hypothetical protein
MTVIRNIYLPICSFRSSGKANTKAIVSARPWLFGEHTSTVLPRQLAPFFSSSFLLLSSPFFQSSIVQKVKTQQVELPTGILLAKKKQREAAAAAYSQMPLMIRF